MIGILGRNILYVIQSLWVGLAVSATLISSIGDSSGSGSKILTLLGDMGRALGVFVATRNIYDSFRCGVSGFWAANTMSLHFTFLRTGDRADAANYTYFGLDGLSTVLVCWASISGFPDLERRCIPILRHGCCSRIRKVGRVHNFWSLILALRWRVIFVGRLPTGKVYYLHSMTWLTSVACGTPEASFLSQASRLWAACIRAVAIYDWANVS